MNLVKDVTNLFPMESLENTRQKHKDNPIAIKVLDRIEKAQQNYEIRDLLLSVWAKLHPECIAYTNKINTKDFAKRYNNILNVNRGFSESVTHDMNMDGLHELLNEINSKRVIYYNNTPYPFKQSAPKKLVDLFMETHFVYEYIPYNGGRDGEERLIPISDFIMHGGKNDFDYIVESIHDITNNKTFFFCSQEYTKLTNIEPCICTYEESVQLYCDYLDWKIQKAVNKVNNNEVKL